MLGKRVLQVWWWYLHWFRRYRKKTRGGGGSKYPPPPVGRGLMLKYRIQGGTVPRCPPPPVPPPILCSDLNRRRLHNKTIIVHLACLDSPLEGSGQLGSYPRGLPGPLSPSLLPWARTHLSGDIPDCRESGSISAGTDSIIENRKALQCRGEWGKAARVGKMATPSIRETTKPTGYKTVSHDCPSRQA